jgi:uncharacterized protein (TIGR02246 family)
MQIRSGIVAGWLVACSLLAQAATAQDRAVEADLDALRQTARQFETAFNAHNTQQVAALWAADGEYVDEDGHTTTGRAAIEARYAEFFKQYPRIKIRVTIESLRRLNEHAALEDGSVTLVPTPAGVAPVSKYIAVHVKEDGVWKMSAVRERRIESSSHGKLADLAWLIGDWQTETHGAEITINCRWVGDHSHIQRTTTITHPSGLKKTSVQIIGFHPQTQQIQSWTFGDGGHAVGVWAPHDGGWMIETESLLADGSRGSATNYLLPIDNNAFTWQSCLRISEGIRQPNGDELLVKRVSGK